MNNYHPFITIGIASYNYARYLTDAFEAIKRQKFNDFEILYADDGSTDESVAIIESFIRDNPDMDIRLIKGENAGVMANKQRLIDNARGQYIMLCDADDWMDDDCLETLAFAAKETGADRIVTEIRNINGVTGKTMYVQSFPENPSKWCEVLHHGAIYKMAVIRKNNIKMPKELPDDYIFISQFNLFAENTIFVRKSVYNWRIHPKSLSFRFKHNNEYGGYTLLNNTILFLNRTKKEFSDCLSMKDLEDLWLLLVKNYCFYLINDISLNDSVKSALHDYCKLRDLMRNNIPGYARIIIKRKLKDSPFRGILHIEILVLCLLENINMLFPALMAYGAIYRKSAKQLLK